MSLVVTVPSARANASPVVYVVTTTHQTTGQRWVVERRFTAFTLLHGELSRLDARFASAATLPPKALFNTDPMLIEFRRMIFERYLQAALASKAVRDSAVFLEFLGLPKEDRAAILAANVEEKEGAAAAAPEDADGVAARQVLSPARVTR